MEHLLTRMQVFIQKGFKSFLILQIRFIYYYLIHNNLFSGCAKLSPRSVDEAKTITTVLFFIIQYFVEIITPVNCK